MLQTQQQLPATSVKVSQPDGESDSSVLDQNQLVPVTESIKYRRRAQTAEQKVEQLTKQLQDREQLCLYRWGGDDPIWRPGQLHCGRQHRHMVWRNRAQR